MHIRLALVEAINGFNDLRQVSSPAMASFIVNHLRSRNPSCAYEFANLN